MNIDVDNIILSNKPLNKL